MIITIDGPTASGKSTLAQQIAKKLNIYYLNSGYLYRGLAYILITSFHYDENRLKNPKDEDLKEILNTEKFMYLYDGKNPKIYFNKEDITYFLKTAEYDKYSSIISSNQNVRKILLQFQRNLGQKYDLITEGRDCGSIVFPHADIKIYLTASIEIRAKRWQKDMYKIGKNFSLDQSIKIISDRDERDKNRSISPLIVPKDSIIIDNSNLSQKELFAKILLLINKDK